MVPILHRLFPGGVLSGICGPTLTTLRILPPVFFPAPISLCRAGSDPQQYYRCRGRCSLWNMAFLFPHLRRSSRRFLLLFWLARVLGRDFAGRLSAGGCLKNISRSSRPRLRCSSLWRSFSPFSQTIFCASWPACPRSHSAALRDRPACPPLGTALCQRPGRRRLSCLSVGDGFDRCSGVSPVSSGDEIWGSDRSGHPEALSRRKGNDAAC